MIRGQTKNIAISPMGFKDPAKIEDGNTALIMDGWRY